MTVLALCLVAGLLQTGTRGAQIAASQQTWQGFVTDTHCGTNCQVTKDMKPDKKCMERCVRKGSKYGLWVAAKDVSFTGTLDGETIYIDSIKPSKLATAKKSDTN